MINNPQLSHSTIHNLALPHKAYYVKLEYWGDVVVGANIIKDSKRDKKIVPLKSF